MDPAPYLGGLGGQIGEVPTRIIHLLNDAELPRFDPSVPFVLLDGAGSWNRLAECTFCYYKQGTNLRGATMRRSFASKGNPIPPKTGIIQVRWKGFSADLADWHLMETGASSVRSRKPVRGVPRVV